MISVGHLWVVLLVTTGCHLALCCLLMSASLLESMAAASLHFQWVVSSSPPPRPAMPDAGSYFTTVFGGR